MVENAEDIEEGELWDDERRQFRPLYKGRIRTLGASSSTSEEGELVEVWEGGRMIGYEKTRPNRKGRWLPFLS